MIKSTLNTRTFIFLAMLSFYAIALTVGCSQGGSGDQQWTIDFSRVGGYPDYKDRIIINADSTGEYFHDGVKQGEFKVDIGTMSQAEWVVSREDIPPAVGTYKAIGDVQDNIRYTLNVTVRGKTHSIEWHQRSNHPDVLTELLPSLELMIEIAVNEVNCTAVQNRTGLL